LDETLDKLFLVHHNDNKIDLQGTH
mgnify:CR=1